ncbi:3'-5' exonuclease [Pengzhenrongella frigida]|uniref:3'-5' exonuclease n=1 Tax=Pengzhenrongella frigida TaxID=1259133 RepID=A0A4Q5N139_9MICO|nr:3'-5' exonuclease [Cellulomonas sp. HLT2-17]RYV51872.1 3'-5' exonuclease [Cellulomonas sp. HLT2-17]
MSGYAVVDTETTGFSPAQGDRVLEVAVVLLDDDGRVEREWETLLNPDRGVGPQHVHGISAAEVARAPRFDEIAPYLAYLFSGRLVVGHNIAFDARFLTAEFAAAGLTVPLDPGRCLCTQALARQHLPGPKRTLAVSCEQAGVVHSGAHSAIGDTRATAELLQYFLRSGPVPPPWRPVYDAAVRAHWPGVAPTGPGLGGGFGGPADGMLDLDSLMPAAAPAPAVRVLVRHGYRGVTAAR